MTHPTPESLAWRLRLETKELHVAAERSGVMRHVLRGTVDRATYLRLLRSLGVLYAALEALLANTSSQVAAAFHRPELLRSPAIARDDAVVAGADASLQSLTPVTAATRYADRLRDVADRAPHRLVAHAYVRYFGDLSGGQMLAPLVRKAIPLPDDAGTDFYGFPDIDDIAAYKDGMRALIDAIPAHSSVANDIVDEAQWAFRAHAEMFEELVPAATS